MEEDDDDDDVNYVLWLENEDPTQISILL